MKLVFGDKKTWTVTLLLLSIVKQVQAYNDIALLADALLLFTCIDYGRKTKHCSEIQEQAQVRSG